MPIPEILIPPAPDFALRIKHQYSAGWEQWYLLTGDEHWDSPECYIGLLHNHLKQAKEREALWITNGDFFEAISTRNDPRGSKGTLRKQQVGVNYLDRLVEDGAEEFRPYADSLVYMGTGNHDQAITIKCETDIGKRFADAMSAAKTPGLPPVYRSGYTGWIRFEFEKQNGGGRSSLDMKLEHGTGGNSPVTKGTIQAQRRMSRIDGATFFVSSHIHEQWALSGVVERLNAVTGQVQEHKVKHIQLGSYKRDFRTDGCGTWWTMKSGATKPIGGMWLHFYVRNNRIYWDVIDTEVDYPSLGKFLRRERITVAEEAA
jgi:hypothetical protein